jgi:hypothetical protein
VCTCIFLLRQKSFNMILMTNPSYPMGGITWITTAFFQASTQVILRNGPRLHFWIDRWLDDFSISQLASDLAATVPKWRQKSRSVKSALDQDAWVQDMQGSWTLPVMMQYLENHRRVHAIMLNLGIDDRLVWRWSSSGIYSSSWAYSGSDKLFRRQAALETKSAEEVPFFLLDGAPWPHLDGRKAIQTRPTGQRFLLLVQPIIVDGRPPPRKMCV